MSNNRIMILNGEFVDEQEAAVSPVNRGMMYGDGCFETIRIYAGKFLGWNMHYDRLKAGLNYLGMEANFDSKALKDSIIRLVEKNQLSDREAIVRIQCWRSGGRGYLPSSTQTNWMVQISDISPKKDSLKLTVANTRCIPHEALERQYKLTNGLNYIKAAQEAKANSADDALMLTLDEKVSETTSANIFWIIEGTVYTPSESCDLLPGVTRSVVIRVCEKLDIPVHKGQFNLQDIRDAEAVFCTNSLIEIRAVSSIETIEFQPNHPVLEQIKVGFEMYKKEQLE